MRRHRTRKALGVRHLLRGQDLGRWLPPHAQRGALKEVLEKPLPRRGKTENLVPPGAKLRSLFMEMLNELGEVPEDETSRRVLIRMVSGPKYEAYRGRANRILEHLDSLTNHLEEIRAGSEGPEVGRVRG